jgi:hypothetical protein
MFSSARFKRALAIHSITCPVAGPFDRIAGTICGTVDALAGTLHWAFALAPGGTECDQDGNKK